jgi:hypothetical protein
LLLEVFQLLLIFLLLVVEVVVDLPVLVVLVEVRVEQVDLEKSLLYLLLLELIL